jgi:hypothetical protein
VVVPFPSFAVDGSVHITVRSQLQRDQTRCSVTWDGSAESNVAANHRYVNAALAAAVLLRCTSVSLPDPTTIKILQEFPYGLGHRSWPAPIEIYAHIFQRFSTDLLNASECVREWVQRHKANN